MTAAARSYFVDERRRPIAWKQILAEGNLAGADDEVESEAGDKAIPLEFLRLPQNDVTEKPDRDRLWERLNKQEYTERLMGYFVGRHGYPPDQAKDAVQMTLVRAIQAKRWPEDETRSLYTWLRRYANITRLRYQRALLRGEKVQATEDMDVYPVELKPYMDVYFDVLAAIRAVVEKGGAIDASAARAILAKALHDKSYKESALELGITEETMNQRVRRVLVKVRKELGLSGSAGSAAVIFSIIFLLIQFRPREPVNTTSGRPTTTASVTLPQVPPPATAMELRQRGLAQCDQGHFDVCLKLLDRAKKMDPAGDTAPAIVKARADAAKATPPDDKPH